MSSNIIEIYPEEPCNLPIQYESNPLTPYGKTYQDIENILICFKILPTEENDAYLSLLQKDESNQDTGSILLDEETHTFTLVKTENDILPVNNQGYQIFLGVKVTGLSKMIWLRIENETYVRVEEDGIIN